MKNGFVFLFIATPMFVSLSHAHFYQRIMEPPRGFMTTRDLIEDAASGVLLQNVSGSSEPLAGLYIQNTSSAQGDLIGSRGNAFGVLWTSVSVNASSTEPLGKNYLYNMLMNLIAQASLSGSGTLITPGANDVNPWTLQLGVIRSQAGVVGCSSSIPTSATGSTTCGGAAGTGTDLVSGGFAQSITVNCDDSLQTCTPTAAVTQKFPCNNDVSTGC